MIVETNLVKLVAQTSDSYGYITYVFNYLDQYDINKYECKSMVCTRYPNWNCRDLKIGDEGYVNTETVRAGIDTWFNGEEQVPYRYNSVRFIKFIDKPSENSNEYSL